MSLKSRPCPLCGLDQPKPLMKFSCAQLARLNPTYKLPVLEEACRGLKDEIAYCECPCGMIYCAVTWSDEFLNKVYEQVIQHDASWKKTLQLDKRLTFVREWEGLLRALAIRGCQSLEGITLLDFGCGWGDFLDVSKGPGVKSIGFEQDRIKIQGAREHGHWIIDQPDELKEHLPVDVFVLNSVIEHVQDIPTLMRRAYDALKPGGILMVKTMDFRRNYTQRNRESLETRGINLNMLYNPIEHVNIYDYSTLRRTIEKYGFRFFATEWTLRMADFPVPFLRNSRTWIRWLNQWERFLSSIVLDGDRSIAVYAVKE